MTHRLMFSIVADKRYVANNPGTKLHHPVFVGSQDVPSTATIADIERYRKEWRDNWNGMEVRVEVDSWPSTIRFAGRVDTPPHTCTGFACPHPSHRHSAR